MELVFKEAKEEHGKYEESLKVEQDKEQEKRRSLDFDKLRIEMQSEADNAAVSVMEAAKPKARGRKSSAPLSKDKVFAPGSTVRVVSGNFANFVGSLKKVNRMTKKATVGFTLFGKESLVDLDLNEIVAETK